MNSTMIVETGRVYELAVARKAVAEDLRPWDTVEVWSGANGRRWTVTAATLEAIRESITRFEVDSVEILRRCPDWVVDTPYLIKDRDNEVYVHQSGFGPSAVYRPITIGSDYLRYEVQNLEALGPITVVMTADKAVAK